MDFFTWAMTIIIVLQFIAGVTLAYRENGRSATLAFMSIIPMVMALMARYVHF